METNSKTFMTKTEMIEDSIKKSEERLKTILQAYGNLHQIDRLSGEGNSILEEISFLKGYIKALRWVLSMTKS
jgi:hypothetical protein